MIFIYAVHENIFTGINHKSLLHYVLLMHNKSVVPQYTE